MSQSFTSLPMKDMQKKLKKTGMSKLRSLKKDKITHTIPSLKH